MTSRTASNAEVPGWYIEFQANVLRQLPRPGEIDATTAQGWSQNQKALKRVLTEILLPETEVWVMYTVIVDRSKTLSAMIHASNLLRCSSEINDKNFPVQGDGLQEVELVLVHLDRRTATEAVLAYLDAHGLEPARLEHLLAFWVKYSDVVRREISVVALGSVWINSHGRRNAPVLSCDGNERKLSLGWIDAGPWDNVFRFLAVRKAA